MNIDTLIDDLKDFCSKGEKTTDKSIYQSFQKEYLNGQAGAIINNMGNDYEIYIYIKNKDKIVSPLARYITSSEEEANNYYTKLINLLNNENCDDLIAFCKNQK